MASHCQSARHTTSVVSSWPRAILVSLLWLGRWLRSVCWTLWWYVCGPSFPHPTFLAVLMRSFAHFPRHPFPYLTTVEVRLRVAQPPSQRCMPLSLLLPLLLFGTQPLLWVYGLWMWEGQWCWLWWLLPTGGAPSPQYSSSPLLAVVLRTFQPSLLFYSCRPYPWQLPVDFD